MLHHLNDWNVHEIAVPLMHSLRPHRARNIAEELTLAEPNDRNAAKSKFGINLLLSACDVLRSAR